MCESAQYRIKCLLSEWTDEKRSVIEKIKYQESMKEGGITAWVGGNKKCYVLFSKIREGFLRDSTI